MMQIPFEVRAMIGRLDSPQARIALTQALGRWENANRSLTRAMIVGVHKIPATLEAISLFAVFTGNPLARIVVPVLKLPSLLELWIRKMAADCQRKGTLTDETRRHFEELVNAIEQAQARRTFFRAPVNGSTPPGSLA